MPGRPEPGAPPSRAAALANGALAKAWAAGALPRPKLDARAFEKRALRGAPGETLGPDTGWREPFERLVAALRDEADLNPLGLTMAHGQIVQALRARIRAHRLWRAHPEILARPIAAPVIILGTMRSGTTRLHRLLACDPRFAHTRLFESLIPVPLSGPRDSRILRARFGLAALRRFNPALAAIHPMSPFDAEEEFGLFSFSFGSPQFEAQWRVPGFVGWWEAADPAWLYREFRALLQTIAWSRGDSPKATWLLKAPQFMQDLPAILEAFPDARLICLDRDLDAVVASSASLVWHQMRIQSDRADQRWIGREWLRKTLLRRQVADAARRDHPGVPQIDIGYQAMERDWRGEIHRIYTFLDLPLPAAVEARMSRYLGAATSHRGHRYSLEQFGLSPNAVRGLGLTLYAHLAAGIQIAASASPM